MNEPAESSPRYQWQLLVRRTLAVLAGAVFIYAGTLKVGDPLRFASDINNYQLIPWKLGVRLAFYLPWLEIICGFALVVHRMFAGAVVLSLTLMVTFTGATLWAKAHNINVACGCFGTASSNLTLTWHLVLNGCIIAVLATLWITRRRFSKTALAAASLRNRPHELA